MACGGGEGMNRIITLKDIQKNPVIAAMVAQANDCLEQMGYTDHGPRHVGYVARITADILHKLGYPERMVELGRIAGWTHDVGNLINRYGHAQHGASIMFPVLREIGMPLDEVLVLVSAIGNHDEQNGAPVSAVSAALIIADKVDAHRARVRRNRYDFNDIHDRVNYSIRRTRVTVDADERIIRYYCFMDQSSSVKDFLTIYMSRMTLAEHAARYLGCTFELVINDMLINNTPQAPAMAPTVPNNGEEE
jgi:metal-dependent HD superfamily phosphatase/phosphodiesterase